MNSSPEPPLKQRPISELVEADYLSWQPSLFAASLATISVLLGLCGQPLWGEFLFLVNGALLGWVLAFSQGPAWQKMLVVWLLAVTPVLLVSLPIWWWFGELGIYFPLLRGQVVFLTALLTAVSLILGNLIIPLVPRWLIALPLDPEPDLEAASPPPARDRASARYSQWTTTDWGITLVLLAVSLAIAQYLVDRVWALAGLLDWENQPTRWSYWQTLLRLFGSIALAASLNAVLVVLPLTHLSDGLRPESSELPSWMAKAAGYWAVFGSPLLLFFPAPVALEWLGLIVTSASLTALFLYACSWKTNASQQPE